MEKGAEEGKEGSVLSEQVESPNKTYLFHLRSARASMGGRGLDPHLGGLGNCLGNHSHCGAGTSKCAWPMFCDSVDHTGCRSQMAYVFIGTGLKEPPSPVRCKGS